MPPSVLLVSGVQIELDDNCRCDARVHNGIAGQLAETTGRYRLGPRMTVDARHEQSRNLPSCCLREAASTADHSETAALSGAPEYQRLRMGDRTDHATDYSLCSAPRPDLAPPTPA